jgi:putative glutamine amidotransferase
MKPLIGINLDISKGPPAVAKIQSSYFESVLAAGGIPVLLAPMPDEDLKHLLVKLSGILLIGGLDYCPTLYGEEPTDSVELIDPRRQDFDLRLVRYAAQRRDLPFLGICGGCQVLNIGLGGSLIQDISSELPQSNVAHVHSDSQKTVHKHPVLLEEGTRLAGIYKRTRLDVPTNHHQAVKILGKGLRASAKADDGIVEALESTDHRFMLGVQWHPERDFEGNEPLFKEFVTQSASALAAGQ